MPAPSISLTPNFQPSNSPISFLLNLSYVTSLYLRYFPYTRSSCSLSKEKLRELIAHVDPNGTRDYSIVGIMGVQSSGKSTLLNKLFKTKFQMMNSRTGRQQTTRGIWLDAARNTPNLVIMDLEGTDSGERGEDRTTFERQTILYGLALCEILIVNMWEHDIGRYTASNYGVLKTVFEVNLQIFKAQGKTMLLFIVRDHIEQTTPAAALETKLRKDIQVGNHLRSIQTTLPFLVK